MARTLPSARPPGRAVRSAFTLIELLVVIAIIAILIGLLVPAVQQVREAANRATCQNNLHQWAVAMHNHHDTYKHFPPGEIGDNGSISGRQTWVMRLWPYIEAGTLWNAITANPKVSQPFYTPPCTVYNTMNGLCAVAVPLYSCPDDNGPDLDDPSQTYCRVRGNYVVCFGQYYQDVSNPGKALAMFGEIGGSRITPQLTRMVMISDGTSSSLMMSELLKGLSHDDNDWRGDILNDDGTNHFMTFTTPNSSVPDQISGNYDQGAPDPLMPVISNGSQEFNAARSRHTAGVNVSMADASVRFVSNSITLATWQALGTINGNDVPGSDWEN